MKNLNKENRMSVDIENLANQLLNNVGKNKVTNKKITKFSLPGKGRKMCSSCGSYIPVRTQECECGHVFGKKDPVKVVPISTADKNAKYDEPVTDEDRRYAIAAGLSRGCTMIYAGAGKCPAVLRSVDSDFNPRDPQEVIREFCEDVVSAGIPDKKLYMPSAIKNWLAGFVDRNNKPELFDLVDRWYDERVASTMEDDNGTI